MALIGNLPRRTFGASEVATLATSLNNTDEDGWSYHPLPVPGSTTRFWVEVRDDQGEVAGYF